MTSERTRTADEARIRKVIEEWSNALRAKDASGVVAHLAEGFVQYSLAPPLRSTAADAEGLEAWFATWEGPLGYDIRDLDIALGDEAAFCHSLNRLSGTKVGGHRTVLWFRLTLGFRKVGGAWKIAHEHESVPFHMDGSFKAALDLEP